MNIEFGGGVTLVKKITDKLMLEKLEKMILYAMVQGK